jgi:chemotaxis protein CheD
MTTTIMKTIVSIGDMKIATDPATVLVTHGLGSCLGIAVHDPHAGVAGMLHVMMPRSSVNPAKAKGNPYLFVDTGVPAFLEALTAAGASKGHWTVRVCGGASTQTSGTDHFEIGRQNYVMLRKILWQSGILIDAEDIGGSIARGLYIDVGSGRIWMSKAGVEYDL